MREFLTLIGLLLPLFLLGGIGWFYWMEPEHVVVYVVAAGVCLIFGASALLVQEMAFRFNSSLTGTLGSIVVRTLGPIAFGLFVKKNLPDFVEHRFFLAFVGCYLLTLAMETILSVRLVNRWEKLLNNGAESLGNDST